MESRKPDIAVVIPTYNRPAQLAECLASLAKQTLHRERFEVIVVDDGSRWKPEPVVSRFHSRLQLLLLRQPNRGPAAARNFGVSKARGAFVAFTDDDCRPAEEWLSKLATGLSAAPDCIVGGRTVNGLEDNPYAAASQLIVDLVYRHYNADRSRARFFATNNMALSIGIFRSMGGFDPNFRTSEDRDFCDRARIHGHRLIYEPAAIVYHFHHLTLLRYCRQHFSYGKGAFHFHRAQKKRGARDATLEPKFYTSTFRRLKKTLRRLSPATAASTAALMLLWQGAYLWGFAATASLSMFKQETMGDDPSATIPGDFHLKSEKCNGKRVGLRDHARR